jgi:hypothetical protein
MVQVVSAPAGRTQTSPGPTSCEVPSWSIVARPERTTKVSSASTSVTVPSVQRQTPVASSAPPGSGAVAISPC